MQIMKFYKISFPLNKLKNMHIIKQEEWKEAGRMCSKRSQWLKAAGVRAIRTIAQTFV